MSFWARLQRWLIRLCEIVTRQECTRHSAQVAEATRWYDESNRIVQQRTQNVQHALSRLNTSL